MVATTSPEDVRRVLRAIADEFPAGIRAHQHADVERVAFELSIAVVPGKRLVDLGGGVGLFSLGASKLGMDVVLVDDFGDPVNVQWHPQTIGLHDRYGVTVFATDVRTWAAEVEPASVDVVTCFETMEHWHHSPRAVLEGAHRALVPGGRIVVSGPNAVNLRKRLAVPLGRTNWSRFDDWFGQEEFRGHVREPILADLERVLRETGFTVEDHWGRNWETFLGALGRLPKPLLRGLDAALQWRPTLCAALYVRGTKPG
jgi:2-polyprenyl-3-methyl-5-hydroxy-6-metoxy-1,4-benzoquinol methylase